MLLRLLLLVIYITLLWGFITQILLPLYNNEPLFPFFRKRKKLEEKLIKATESLGDAKIVTKIKKVEKQVKKEKEVK